MFEDPSSEESPFKNADTHSGYPWLEYTYVLS